MYLEQDLDDLLEDGQQAAMVYPNAALEYAQHVAQRRQLPVCRAQHLQHVVVHLHTCRARRGGYSK
jgi:hypothetical protein